MKKFMMRSYADNRFMEKGVQLQNIAQSFHEAQRNYNNSCMLCCTKGVGAVVCAHCPIRDAFLCNADLFFRSELTKDDKRYVEKERELL